MTTIDAQQFAATELDPITNPSEWDYIVLAGCISPGVATVSGCDVQYRWDEPQSKGSSGSDSPRSSP
ncbi:MAG: hypothetical protein HY908_02145 [Myxococcales bacterium]|nr:hypothetical protein [Myxococcales bacterium]